MMLNEIYCLTHCINIALQDCYSHVKKLIEDGGGYQAVAENLTVLAKVQEELLLSNPGHALTTEVIKLEIQSVSLSVRPSPP